MSEAKVFIVDESPASTTTAPAPGYWKRLCSVCGQPWGPTRCSSHSCSSMEFTDSYIEPVPFMTRIQEKLVPKKAPPRASAAQVERLRALEAAVTALLDDLRRTDEELIAAVRGDVEELIPIQGAVNTALSITGDRSSHRIAGLSLSLESFRDALTISIQTIEGTSK